MRLDFATIIATQQMSEHGLLQQWPPWRLVYSSTRHRFGCCSFKRREIELSRPFVAIQDENEEGERAVREVVLHEIAHALAGVAGHGPMWKKLALALGCDRPGKKLPDWVKLPESRFLLVCPSCGHEYRAHVRVRAMDERYCSKHGRKVRGDPRYRLRVIEREVA